MARSVENMGNSTTAECVFLDCCYFGAVETADLDEIAGVQWDDGIV